MKIITSVIADECIPFTSDELPVNLVVKKMASLGLPMVESGELGKTMWSKDEPKYVAHDFKYLFPNLLSVLLVHSIALT